LGIATGQAEFLIQARRDGVGFDKTLTIGRQNFLVSPRQLEKLFRRNQFSPAENSPAVLEQSLDGAFGYADQFFRMLGARTVDSLDASPFEGATIVHDLNCPIRPELHRAFDAVVDGGSLEHVFNFPVALQSCMEMVKVGGHLIVITPANNYCGHGFYQFSPELFFRVLSDRNGFAVERMIAFENDVDVGMMFGHTYLAEIAGPWFDVADPEAIGDRVLLLNRRPVLLMIRAARVRDTRVLATFPQQSDYTATWIAHERESVAPARPQPPRRWIDRVVGRRAIVHLKFHVMGAIMRWLAPLHTSRIYRRRQFRNRRSYRPAADQSGRAPKTPGDGSRTVPNG
jgi:SAM-dependent methyltransferase